MKTLHEQGGNRPDVRGADGNPLERKDVECIKQETTVLGKAICIFLGKTSWGIDVLITGGDRPHIGAVTVVDDQARLHTQVFEGHKDNFISEEWAKILYGQYQVPIVVSVGIHYDGIDQAGIKTVMGAMKEQLECIVAGMRGEHENGQA